MRRLIEILGWASFFCFGIFVVASFTPYHVPGEWMFWPLVPTVFFSAIHRFF